MFVWQLTFSFHFISFHFHSITEGGPSAGADLQGALHQNKTLILQEPDIKIENINF